MAGSDNILDVLELFTLERPVWTADEVSAALEVSPSSAYRYLANLLGRGLLATVATGRYTLGPAIIQFDRQIQLGDPLLRAAQPLMRSLVEFAPTGSAILLCRFFQTSVLCIHQVLGRGPQSRVSYERGKPMPLFRGATSKAILAHLSPRRQKELYAGHGAEIAAAGLGADYAGFRAALAGLRKSPYIVTRQEIDPDRVGIAAAILGPDRQAIGSLSYVVQAAAAEEVLIRRLGVLVGDAADQLGQGPTDAGLPIVQQTGT